MEAIKILMTVAILNVTFISANAQVITFEPDANGCLPDGSLATDNMIISNQFLRSGVIFGIDDDRDGVADTNTFAYLEAAGDDEDNSFGAAVESGSGFIGEADYANDGTENQLGQYFLRSANTFSETNTHALLVSYAYPVQKASGEIWDIDAEVGNSDPALNGYEQWQIEALDQDNQVLTNLLSPEGIYSWEPESLDGLPWEFEVCTPTKNISALRISFTGTKENLVGIAFNNFSPSEGLGSTNVIGVAYIQQAVEVFWQTQLGKTYQLQWTEGLGGQWHNLGEPVMGTGVETSVLDSSRGVGSGKRMYRVLEMD
jgi:hypothetical protein